jgi:DNA-binding CsgD family transcriptional regulator
MNSNLIYNRDKEVLHLIAKEYSPKQIVLTLYISTYIVLSHRKSLLEKLNAKMLKY